MPAVKLSSWILSTSLFDGEHAAGPVPTLFTTDVEATKQAIAEDPSKIHWDCQRVAKIFFSMECVLVKDSAAILKKPR